MRTLSIGVLFFFVNVLEGLGLSMVIPVFEKMFLKDSQNITAKYLEKAFLFLGIQETLINIFIIVVSIFIFKSTLMFVARYLVAKFAADFLEDVKLKGVEGILKSSLNYFNAQKISVLINSLTNEAQRAAVSYVFCAQWLSFAMSLVLYTVLAYMVAGNVAFVAMILGVLVLSPLRWLAKRNQIHGVSLTENNEDFGTSLLEHFNAFKVIKAFSNEGKSIQHIFKNLKRVRESWQKVYFHSNSLDMYSQPLVVILLCSILYMAKMQGIGFGEVILFLVAFQRLLPAFTQMLSVQNSLAMTLPGFDAITKLIQESNHSEEKNPGDNQDFANFKISFDHVGFHYPNDHQMVLKDVNFEAMPGKITALVGRSGSGKTTIVDLILGFYQPQKGMISVGKAPFSEIDLFEYRRHISYVTQEHYLFNGTIRENILWGSHDPDNVDLDEVLRLSHCDEFVNKLDAGLDTQVGDRGAFLSGGQKQRISLARAIIRKPKLLILDEATSALDYVAERAVSQTITHLRSHYDVTILVIAHRMESIKFSDEILVLDQGNIVERGNWSSLSENASGYIGKALELEEDLSKN